MAPGFSFYLTCHFTLPFAVISVRSGEQEVSGATRSSKPFWILLMPHLTARPTTGTLIPMRFLRSVWRSEARGKVAMCFGHPIWQVVGAEQPGFGEFSNAGRQWRPEGSPAPTLAHDFPDDAVGKAVPYGIYDLTANAGWVNVGTDQDTAAFAVESVRRWWKAAGQEQYPQARQLVVTADAGGSNGYRTRAWKAELAALALETGSLTAVRISCGPYSGGPSRVPPA
jgi:hypothetical protein